MNKFDNLNIPRHWEPYWTKYPEGYSILEALIQWVSQVNEMVDNVNEWNIYLEEFVENFDRKLEPTVVKWLEKMLGNGTLAKIINETIFQELNNKVDGKQDFDTLPYADVTEYQRRYDLTFTQAFQACLDRAKTTIGGVHVIVPPGVHKLTEELVAYSNTKIECVEGAVLERHHEGYFILNGVRGSTYYEYLGNGNIQVIGGVWDGRATQVEGTGSHFALGHAHRVIFKDVTIKDANSHHIELNACKDVLVDNCRIVGLVEGNQYAEAIQLDLSSQPEGFGAFGAYDMTPCVDIEVRDCYFGESGTPGTKSIARAFGSHSTRIGTHHQDIRFLNNTVERATDYAVNTLSYEDFLADGNTFIACSGGIILYSPLLTNENHMWDVNGVKTTNSQVCKNFKITNNIFKKFYTKACVYLYGSDESGMLKNVLIHGNTVDDTTPNVNACVVSRFAEFVEVSGNYFYGVDTIPLSFNSTNRDVTISNNHFDEPASSCVRATGQASRFIISQNLCKRAGRHAFEIYGADVNKVVVTDNIIQGTNGSGGKLAAIYMHSGVSQVSVRGNIINKEPGYEYTLGIYITSTTKDSVMGGNIVETGTEGAITAVSTHDMGNVIVGQPNLTNVGGTA